MARVTPVLTREGYPKPVPDGMAEQVGVLFGTLFPGVPNPEFDEAHEGIAIAALNPQLALTMAKATGFMVGQLHWSQLTNLRELAIQAVNVRLKSPYSFRSRTKVAAAAGISIEQQNALASWRESSLFDGEQRLVIEYANAVVNGKVEQDLFDRIVVAFGEKGAVECTALIGFFAFWAMFLNATRPD